MMGRQKPRQPSLFYHRINLEERVRQNHVLRKIDGAVDFDFIYAEVAEKYGSNGNESIPPPVILRMMVLLVFYNVRSERELMATIAERLDWLWFLGFDFDSEIPDHSVLSKARARWGEQLFRVLFERTVRACVSAGLVDGRKMFCDSSLVEANASMHSIVDRGSLRRHLNRAYRKMERRLEREQGPRDVEEDDDDPDAGRRNLINRRHVSTTDPDADLVRKGKGSAKLVHQSHRGIDSACGVITATILGPGDENEAHRLTELLDQHAENTGTVATTAVGDSKYGTNENLILCHDRGVKLHTRPLKDVQQERTGNRGIFPEDRFEYDAETDTYVCPAGQRLRKRNHRVERGASEYCAPRRVCRDCELRPLCTRSQTGRSIKRHDRQDAIDAMRRTTQTAAARSDLKRRQHFMEGSFAQATRYGFKRARYRRRWRASIQDLLIAAVQNIELLVRYAKPRPAMALEAIAAPVSATEGILTSLDLRLRRALNGARAFLRSFIQLPASSLLALEVQQTGF